MKRIASLGCLRAILRFTRSSARRSIRSIDRRVGSALTRALAQQRVHFLWICATLRLLHYRADQYTGQFFLTRAETGGLVRHLREHFLDPLPDLGIVADLRHAHLRSYYRRRLAARSHGRKHSLRGRMAQLAVAYHVQQLGELRRTNRKITYAGSRFIQSRGKLAHHPLRGRFRVAV